MRAEDIIRKKVREALSEQRERLLRSLRKLDIWQREDIEPFIDEMQKQAWQAQLKQRSWLNLEENYSKHELGLRRVLEVDTCGDKGGDECQINRAIQKISAVSDKISGKKPRTARKLLEAFASAGYYAYLVLRKKLGIPCEHPVLREWYAGFLPWIPSLINPGGCILLKEGTYSISDQILINVSNITLQGVYGASIIKPTGDTSTGDIIRVGEADVFNVKISDLVIDGSNVTKGYAINFLGGSSASEYHYCDRFIAERLIVKNGCSGIIAGYGYALPAGDPYLKGLFYGNTMLEQRKDRTLSVYSRSEGVRDNVIISNNVVRDCYDNCRGAYIIADNEVINSGELFVGFIACDNYVRSGRIVVGYFHNQLVANNVCLNARITSYGYDKNYIAIINNYLDCGGQANPGIYRYKGKYGVIAFNRVYNAGEDGILLVGTQHSIIAHNIIIDPSTYSAGYKGIYLTGVDTTYATHNKIYGNIIIATAGNRPDYCIAEADANQDYNIYERNYLVGASDAPLNVLGSNSLVRSNYNAPAMKTVTADYAMSWADESILADASSAAITVTLPDPASYPNYEVMIKKIDSSANAVTITPYGSETIDGASSLTLANQNDAVRLRSDGTNWFSF